MAKITNDYLQECGFECDVEMNLSVHYWKDNRFEIIDNTEVDPSKNLGWELIIFGDKPGYGNCRLIASIDEVEKIKQLLEIFDIDPNNYLK